jgi:hypothetical protein
VTSSNAMIDAGFRTKTLLRLTPILRDGAAKGGSQKDHNSRTPHALHSPHVGFVPYMGQGINPRVLGRHSGSLVHTYLHILHI